MAKRSKQLEFFGKGLGKVNDCFGGSRLTSNPKVKRPLDSKLPLHIVLRANQSGMRLPKSFKLVNGIVTTTAKKHGVRVYDFSNNGNHLHILVRLGHIRTWAAFIRELTGRIAQAVAALGIKLKADRFWMSRPFTRIVRGWRKPFQILKDYIYLNQIEAEGFIDRRQTKTLKDLRELLGTG